MDDPYPGLGSPTLVRVLEAAARLQQLLPDAVLVGGSAAASYAEPADLTERFDVVLEAVESQDGWVTNRLTLGKIIQPGDIETGIRQMIRLTPLEVSTVTLPSGHTLRAPTPGETLRIKGFLVVRRNQTRDFLDVAALADRLGVDHAGATLARIDDFYADQRGTGDGIASQLARQLADPRPKDASSTRDLAQYKNLAERWREWSVVTAVCRAVAAAMLAGGPPSRPTRSS